MGVTLQHPDWLQSQLSRRLWKMQQLGTLCDVTIHPADEAAALRAHSAVLAAASPRLQQLFQTLKEGHYTVCTAAISAPVWNYLLQFVYLGLVDVEEQHVDVVKKIARKLEITLEANDGADEDGMDNDYNHDVDECLTIDDNNTEDILVDNANLERRKSVDNMSSNQQVSKQTAAAELETLSVNDTPTKDSASLSQSSEILPHGDKNAHSDSKAPSDDLEKQSDASDGVKNATTAVLPFVPSVGQFVKEASSRRRKSTPHKVIKETSKPQIAQVQPTPLFKQETSTLIKRQKIEEPVQEPVLVPTDQKVFIPISLTNPSPPPLPPPPSTVVTLPNPFPPTPPTSNTHLLTNQLLPGVPTMLNAPYSSMLYFPPMPPLDLGPPWGKLQQQRTIPIDKNPEHGMFSVSEPPHEYNEFIQWVKAVRAKLRISQTALSDALNNEPALTKRYSQTIISSFETFKMSQKEVAFLRPFIVNYLQSVATKLGVNSA